MKKYLLFIVFTLFIFCSCCSENNTPTETSSKFKYGDIVTLVPSEMKGMILQECGMYDGDYYYKVQYYTTLGELHEVNLPEKSLSK